MLISRVINRCLKDLIGSVCVPVCVCIDTLNSNKYYVGTNTERNGEEAKRVAIHSYYESTGVKSF